MARRGTNVNGRAFIIEQGNTMKTKKAVTIIRFEPKTNSRQGDSTAEIPQKQGIVGYKKPPVATQFKPGQSPNPGGKPVGSRNKLQGDFMRALSEDFAAHGKAAIAQCRAEKPDVYLRIVASLFPNELEVKRPLDDLSDEELENAIALLRQELGKARTLN